MWWRHRVCPRGGWAHVAGVWGLCAHIPPRWPRRQEVGDLGGGRGGEVNAPGVRVACPDPPARPAALCKPGVHVFSRPHPESSPPQKSPAAEAMLVWCWTSVCDGGPTANQHCVTARCQPPVFVLAPISHLFTQPYHLPYIGLTPHIIGPTVKRHNVFTQHSRCLFEWHCLPCAFICAVETLPGGRIAIDNAGPTTRQRWVARFFWPCQTNQLALTAR